MPLGVRLNHAPGIGKGLSIAMENIASGLAPVNGDTFPTGLRQRLSGVQQMIVMGMSDEDGFRYGQGSEGITNDLRIGSESAECNSSQRVMREKWVRKNGLIAQLKQIASGTQPFHLKRVRIRSTVRGKSPAVGEMHHLAWSDWRTTGATGPENCEKAERQEANKSQDPGLKMRRHWC